MKKFHPFFAIGTTGMIVIASIHMFLSLGLSITVNQAMFFTLYPIFLSFIILGFVFTVKRQKIIG